MIYTEAELTAYSIFFTICGAVLGLVIKHYLDGRIGDKNHDERE